MRIGKVNTTSIIMTQKYVMVCLNLHYHKRGAKKYQEGPATIVLFFIIYFFFIVKTRGVFLLLNFD